MLLSCHTFPQHLRRIWVPKITNLIGTGKQYPINLRTVGLPCIVVRDLQTLLADFIPRIETPFERTPASCNTSSCSKLRREGNLTRDRERESTYRDRDFREREPERDWGRLRRPGAGGGALGSGLRGGGGDGDHRRPPTSGLAALERAGSAAW